MTYHFYLFVEKFPTLFNFSDGNEQIYLVELNLFKAKLASSDLCYLCLKTKQDLKRMLVSCTVVTEFWKIFLEWYETLTAAELELSTVKIWYGIIENDHFLKLIN